MSASLSRGAGICLFALAAGCAKSPPPPGPPAAAPVTVAQARVRTVPVQLRAIGTVRVYATVAVRPRVGGELTAVHFTEGEYVKKGDKLFTVDPRPYQTALDQSKAQLDRDLALLRGAELVLDRARQLTGTAAITADELDKLRTEVASAGGTVAADRAAVRTAELQLGFTTIVSPIDGRTGNLLVAAGNLVSANEVTPLVVINQITPISVAFSVPEQNLAAIGENLRKHGGKLPVAAALRDGTPAVPGELTFVDNSVDPTTGMVQLKATFANQDRRLWPGQFVDVVLILADRPHSVTVPSTAVQDGQDGAYVFVVGADNKAEYRPVEVAFVAADGDAVVAEGLAAGETVVTDGHLRVTPGGKVAIKGPAAAGAQP
ncbi:MAG TPA: efflux RND transporter periplasmic adaptor subunit [Gemmataceae bacterium]|nr:efflux RND transporter periplasmic adaptor subunit [Gemmataceae bacterium]